MNRELLDRIHDQARTEMGFCVQAKDGNWCDRHEALKFPGEEACRVMSVAYVVAEAAVEVAEPLIREHIAAERSYLGSRPYRSQCVMPAHTPHCSLERASSSHSVPSDCRLPALRPVRPSAGPRRGHGPDRPLRRGRADPTSRPSGPCST